jgi:hypothetical protein
MKYVDACHTAGAACVFLDYGSTKQSAKFALGSALLVSNGKDYVYGYGWKPDAWDPMWDIDLGAAKGPRYSGGTDIVKRDFPAGTVTVNFATKTATIPGVA